MKGVVFLGNRKTELRIFLIRHLAREMSFWRSKRQHVGRTCMSIAHPKSGRIRISLDTSPAVLW